MLYSDLFSSVPLSKQRPKVFALQLHVFLFVATLTTEVLVQYTPLISPFASKLDEVFAYCHQNFLLLVDLILDSCKFATTQNIDYVLLRKVTVKKLKQKEKIHRLTSFRRNNELSRVCLRKVGNFMAAFTQTVPHNLAIQEALPPEMIKELEPAITQVGHQIQTALRMTEREQNGNELVVICLRKLEDVSMTAVSKLK